MIHWYPHLLGGGGVAHAVLRLANAQAALGVEVAIAHKCAPDGVLPGVVAHGVRRMPWRQRGGSFLARCARPGPEQAEFAPLLAFAPDLVHVHGEFNPDNLCVPERLRCPLVVSPHGCFHPGVFDKRRSALKRLYFRLARRRLYRHAAFHATSPLEAEHIARLLPKQQVRCAPLAPAVEPPAPTPARPDDGEARLIFVGRLDVYTKGLDILLDAFARAVRICAPTRLSLSLIGGDQGGGLRQLEDRARALGIADRVHFLGQQPAHEVARLLTEADVYVQLSRHEGFGLSVVEALCAGLPTVLTDEMGAASFAEISEQAQVRVVPPRLDAAAMAIADLVARRRELRSLAAEAAPGLRAFFSWETSARMLLDQYLSAMSSPRRIAAGELSGAAAAQA